MATNSYQPFLMDFDRVWWREVIIYEIYVQSFQDSNNDGVGDLQGIINRLDYLKWLGADMLWLTPIYESPLEDQGYDISNYKKINPLFGDMKTWKKLCEAIHAKGMKMMMDMVFNHTSSKHEWFLESKSSKDNPKRDWYFWRKGKVGKKGERLPPNNWESLFGGSAWTYDSKTDEYYLHLFASSQPDLNWDTPAVRHAVFDVVKFWADNGTDGFRFDVINLVSKAPGLPDVPIKNLDKFEQPASEMFTNGPNIHQYLHEMNEKVLGKYNSCSVGEMPCGVTEFEASEYVGKDRRELSMVFQFHHMDLDATGGDKWKVRKWELGELERVLRIWQQHMLGNHGWNSLYLENHDQPRSLSRFGTEDPRYRAVCAKMLATFLLALRGTIFLYQGQELGIPHPDNWKIEDYKDVETLNEYKRRKAENPKKEPDMSSVMHAIKLKGRDNARTPMPWDTSPNSGFTGAGVKPWIKMNDKHSDINVMTQERDQESVLSYFKKLIDIRKQHPLLFYGAFVPIHPGHKHIFSFLRAQGPFRSLIFCSFSPKECEYVIPGEIDIDLAVLVAANYHVTEPKLEYRTVLKPYEARIYALRN
ncbi:hypothetical protein Egran_00628 [Elaphomyces granulatus]|uniref:Glycosyl hydrolase family 13 catalytic domain-containing protein n=1 Tax=Elaphomyces granulatus TaxID=519963 RepID=A0A232M5D1_9EURO|nr:hypothetical protein Egran_00628 [Elaphomyces granulatus]